jgi:cell division protein FtsQ|tara:strand:+ start:15499 stop:16158 length:660 start_codon:yes stop_codon:yes gene_type:complete
MKNRFILGIALFILFSTFISQKKITINKFKIQEIKIENNNILEDRELIKVFSFLYNKNLIFLSSFELKKRIDKKSFIKKLEIKKIFPDKLVIKVFEKEPIAIIIDKYQKKFYLGKKIDLIRYRKIQKYENLPVIKGEQNNFKILYNNLIKINFPTEQILSYRYFKANRWDIEMNDKKILKLPAKNYNEVLINFIDIKDKTNFEKYKIFDYRLNNQLILR